MITDEDILQYAKDVDVFTNREITAYFNGALSGGTLCHRLTRLCEQNKLHRYQRGVYGYIFYSELFQKSGYTQACDAFATLCLRNDDGYYSGATFFNLISLSTWLPAKSFIVTNRVKRKREIGTIVFAPPKTRITSENKRYLQLLDCLETLHRYAVDAPDPYGLLAWYIRESGLKFDILFKLAKEYYSENVLNELNKGIENRNNFST